MEAVSRHGSTVNIGGYAVRWGVDAYRAAGEVGLATEVIVAGPVPVRWWRVAAAVFFAGIGIGGMFFAMQTHRVRCGDGDGCTWTTSYPLAADRVATYRRSQLVEARAGVRRGDKGSTLSHDVSLRFVNGADHRVLSYSDAEDAEAARIALASFFEAPPGAPARVVEVRDSPSVKGFAFALVFLLGGLAFLWGELRDAGRYIFRVDHREGALVITRRMFGFPLRRRVLRIDQVQGLDTDSGVVPDWFRHRNMPVEYGARFELVLRSGERIPLSRRRQRGEFHHDAALAVDAALARESDRAGHAGSPQVFAGPSLLRRISGVVGKGKPLRSVLFLFLGVGTLSVVGNLALRAVVARTQGKIEFHAIQRCRFQGGELLPGGAMQMTLDPGTYTYEVWDPTAPNQWRVETFQSEVGRTTSVECR